MERSVCVSHEQTEGLPSAAADRVENDDEPAVLFLVQRWGSPAAQCVHKIVRLCGRAAPAVSTTLL
jgi:hypothetical protein